MLMKLTPTVNFINVLSTHFLYESAFLQIFYLHVTAKKTYVRKTRMYNIYEIDT